MNYEKAKSEMSTKLSLDSKEFHQIVFTYEEAGKRNQEKSNKFKLRYIEIDAGSIPITELTDPVLSEWTSVPIFASKVLGNLSN